MEKINSYKDLSNIVSSYIIIRDSESLELFLEEFIEQSKVNKLNNNWMAWWSVKNKYNIRELFNKNVIKDRNNTNTYIIEKRNNNLYRGVPLRLILAPDLPVFELSKNKLRVKL